MGNQYKIVVGNNHWNSSITIEYEINCQYNQGWEFVQILPIPGTSECWMFFKRRENV